MKKAFFSLCLFVLGAGASGCGESIVSALLKVANGQISQLTANEIIFLNQAVNQLILQNDPTAMVAELTPAQAQAVANFLQQNMVNTLEDVQNLAAQAEQDPNSIQGLDELAMAFAGTDNEFDPDNPSNEALAEIFDDIFGGGGGGG